MGKSNTTQDDEWVAVMEVNDLVRAQMARGLLESEGVECYVHGEQHRSMLGFIGAYIEPRLMVRSSAVERAQEILESMEEARENPGDVHYLCDADGQGQSELKDLDNLVLDLESLTLCTVGRGTPRDTIELQLGAPSPEHSEPGVLGYPDLGALFYLEDGKLSGFLAIIEGNDDYAGFEEYPGFWDPGSSLTAPKLKDLKKRYGKTPALLSKRRLSEYEWHLDSELITVHVNRSGELHLFGVDFD